MSPRDAFVQKVTAAKGRSTIGGVGARMGAGSWALHYYLQKNNYNITGPGLLHAEQMRLACNVYSW